MQAFTAFPPPAPGLWPQLIFGAQVLSTLALCGLIWFVQLVHYPLFLRVPPPVFAAFEADHARRTGWVAAPLMIVELVTSLLLLNRHLRLPTVTLPTAYLGAALTVLTWLSTFLLQVPLHNRLHRGFDHPAICRLIATNWLRTALWSARTILVLYWTLRPQP